MHLRVKHSALLLLLLALGCDTAMAKKPAAKEQDSLDQYLKQIGAQGSTPALPATMGSIFSPGGMLVDPYADVKARQLGDTISVQIIESTTISQSGSVATDREFTHSSAITGVAGMTPSALNPLLAGNSSTKLSGAGATASQSSLNTVLTAQVVAVLPSGDLVIEAKRQVLANQQHENVVLRGVVRPADISTGNLVHSYQLYNLQLEVKGKGVISDTTRQPNIVVRTLMKILGA